MAKPVNAMTGDAPDGQNPDKKYVPEKTGRFKYTPPPPPKPDPRDAEIFTEEKLRRSGGKMKEPPMGLDSKKRGGVIKRRFASGGEIMDEYDGAMGRGTDTPDKKIAREKSDAAYESDASDKAAGLKASKDEPVGFFKRLMMGNIDKPGSEAYEKLGAGRGKASREAAAETARESGRTAARYTAPDESVRPPPPNINIDDIGREEKNREKYSDFGDAEPRGETVSPSVTKRPVGLASMLSPAKDKVAAPKKDTARKDDVSPQAETKYPGQGREATGKPTAVRDYKTGEKAWEDYKRISTPGKDAIKGFYPEEFLIPGGKAIKYGLGALKGGAKAAGSTSRALAEYETPITFLGKGAQKNITSMERLGANQAKRLTAEEAQGAAAGAAPRVGGPRTAAQKDAAEFIARLKGPKTGGSSGPKGKNPFDAAKDKSPRRQSSFKEAEDYNVDFKRGGNVKRYAFGGSVSASNRGDGCAQRGKTRGTMR
jgi:hypothetical protein